MLFAIYALFTPHDFPEKIKNVAQNMLGNNFRWLFIMRVLFAVGVGFLVIIALLGHKYINHLAYKISFVGLFVWFGWAVALIVTYVLYINKDVIEPARIISVFRIQPIGFWFIPALIFVNGMSPYLGLKTQTSFSMFSNLRTEGGITNHILLPTSMQLNNLQKDLVEVVDTDLDELKPFISDNQVVPYFEFKRITSEANKNFYINYIRNKQIQSVKVIDGISNKPELLVQHNWFLAKLVRFRAVDKGPCLCKH
jgi:hypothetical protein